MVSQLVLLLATASAVPSPSAPPPTIIHETVYPICTVLHANLGNSIQAVLANDQAIDASKPLIADMAQNAGSFAPTMQNGVGNLYGPAALGESTPASELDTERLERVIGTLEHNIEIIKQELKDPSLFPANPQTSSERQAVRLKALLVDVLLRQEQLLNAYYALLDTRQLGNLAQRGDPLQQLFHNDTPDVLPKGSADPLQPSKPTDNTFQNPKQNGNNAGLVNGPLSQLPTQKDNPQFADYGVAGREKALFGRFYQAVQSEQGKISWDESALAERIIITTRECSGKSAVERPY